MHPAKMLSTERLSKASNWPVQCNRTGKTVQSQAIVLGLGSLFNHSTGRQNVGFERDLNMQCITYEALRDIQPKEELCINYGRIWFQDADEDAAQQQSEDINSLDRIQDDIY